ncbi:MAG: twin transmembrane helix small protein [Pseudomonadota bacterium]
MTNDPLFVFVVISMAAVAGILLTGIGGFARGGDFNRKHANRIMRYRILAQFAAVVMILIFAAYRRIEGG